MSASEVVTDKAQREQLASVASSFLRLRPRLLVPSAPLVLLVLYSSPVPREQLAAIALNLGLMLGFFVWEALRVRERPTYPGQFARSLAITILGLASASALSGGAGSPLLPILFAPVGIAFAAFGATRLTLRLLVVLAFGVGYVWFGPLIFPWQPIPAPYAQTILLLSVAIATLLLYFGVTALSSAYRHTQLELDSVRRDVVEAWQRRVSDLHMLGAEVAHEIKNPLASVKGLVRLMYDKLEADPGVVESSVGAPPPGAAAPLTPELQRFRLRLGVVLEEVSRMEHVLGDYLSFARPLSEPRCVEQRLDAFLKGFCTLFSAEAERARVEISLSCPELRLVFDPDKLKQVLLNLAQNALFAMPDGGSLHISAGARGDRVVIELKDSGSGMSTTELARIKEPYFSGKSGGTGLGVVIADAIVTQHGGELSFESKVGVGTSARVMLPSTRFEPG